MKCMDILAPVSQVVHIGVVLAHVVVIVNVRRMTARMIANYLRQHPAQRFITWMTMHYTVYTL